MKKIKRARSVLFGQDSFILSTPALMWVGIFLGAPLAMLVAISFYNDSGPWWSRITVSHYMNLFDTVHGSILLRSLLFAGGTSFFCLLLGYPVAYYLAVCAQRWRGLLLFFFTAPFWTNLIVQMYAWFFLLEQNGLINEFLLRMGIISEPLRLSYTPAAVLLVMVYCYLPLMSLPLYNTLHRLDKRLLEASRDLGATTWETFYRVTLPLSLSGIKVGTLLVFIPAFGEFVIPSVIGGAREFMVGSLIAHYFLTLRNVSLGAALTCTSGLILLLCSLLLHYFFSKKRTV